METPTFRPKRDRRAQPRIPPHDIARITPEDGDIVVREELRKSTLYVLHTAPGADEYQLRSREKAIAEALVLAKRQHVRAWLTADEGYDFTLLEDFRVATALEDVLNRLRAEFLEMPCLRLKPEQVQRLCSVDRKMCQLVLNLLVDEAFLCVTSEGHYARITTGPHPHPA